MNVHHLRAPQEDGALLAHPPLDQVGRCLEDNHRIVHTQDRDLLGKALVSLRDQARNDVLRAARAYLQEAGQEPPSASAGPLLVSGHQPELFHPGVWIKNFALAGLARRHSGTALNLIVDNDTPKNTLLRLPGEGHVVQLPYDHWQREVPFEEYRVRDEKLFRALPEAAAPSLRRWPFQPMLADFWNEVMRQGERTQLVGERFVAARRTWEQRWNCHNLEVPLSRVCEADAFAWFVCHLLANLDRFQETYNGAVQAYRKRYRMRSRNHPVPDLARADDWLEAPFWIWQVEQKRRRRLFVRRSAHGLEIRGEPECGPPLVMSSNPQAFLAQWHELRARGYKVRSRALTTTLFARLFLSDLFLHGLGGGKYDELNDNIVRLFYGWEPPGYVVLTGTLLLPFPGAANAGNGRPDLKTLGRDLRWNPQRHLTQASAEARALAEQKRHWIEKTSSSPEEKRRRFEALRRLNQRLWPFVEGEDEKVRAELDLDRRAARVHQIRSRRDYAFCLYPEERLQRFCTQLL